MTKPKLRKKAEINPPQSPHDGIHTCSRGCTKPGCNRALRDTIEEQDAQIQALKQDLLEKTAAARHLRFERVHDINHIGGQQEEIEKLKEECQRLNSELHTCSCANANMHKYKEENARLKAEVERLEAENANNCNIKEYWFLACKSARKGEAEYLEQVARLKAEVERLDKAGDAMASIIQNTYALYCGNIIADWHAAKEGKQS